jgi:hypothetical protein
MSITGQPPDQFPAVIRPADRIDYLIGRRVHATDFPPAGLWSAPQATRRQRDGAAQSKLFAAHDRSIWLSLGHTLKAQYDAFAPPMPQRIAVLVEQLERPSLGLPSRHWLDCDPVALAVLVIGIATIELLALLI